MHAKFYIRNTNEIINEGSVTEMSRSLALAHYKLSHTVTKPLPVCTNNPRLNEKNINSRDIAHIFVLPYCRKRNINKQLYLSFLCYGLNYLYCYSLFVIRKNG